MPKSNEPLPVKDLEVLLQQTLGSQIKLKDVEWRNLTDPGDNYGSLVIAIDLSVLGERGLEINLHLVAKLPPLTQYQRDLFNTPLTFTKELNFYRDFVPSFIELQLESGFRQDELIILSPKYYGGRLGLVNPNEFDDDAAIIMENLNHSGYSMQNRILGLDEEHLKIAIKELAQLHALTIGLRKKKPKLFESLIVPVLDKPTKGSALSAVLGMIRGTHEYLKKNMPNAQPYTNSIDKTLRVVCEKLSKSEKNEGPWSTLLHNDYWVNNMMFRYDEVGKVIDMKIVDFQLGFYDSGIKDLIFLLMTSARKKTIDENLDGMIDLYYDSFIGCLESLKVDVQEFSRAEYDEELRRCAPLEFGHCIMMIQVIKAERNTASEIDDNDNNENMFSKHRGKLHDETLLHILHTFDRKGWLLT